MKNSVSNSYKRVGIVTFHFSKSHGALLQAYALCKVINSFKNISAEIIDYKPAKIVRSKKGLNRNTIFHPKRFVNYMLYIQPKISKFIKNYIPISKYTYRNANQLKSKYLDYDYLITGSDQVWNSLIFPDFDPSYFLEFGDGNRSILISYAASFGQTQPKKYWNQMAELIRRIDFISVREAQGRSIVEELTGRSSLLVLDPTLLLTDYDELIIPPKTNQSYIAVYCLEESTTFLDLVNFISQEVGLPVIWLNSGAERKNEYSYYLSHNKWLGFLKNAQFVITNSFHGVAFSIIFNKNFFALKISNRFVRISDLLKTLHLESRIISSVKVIKNGNLLFDEIDYELVNEILTKERAKSLSFLERALNL